MEEWRYLEAREKKRSFFAANYPTVSEAFEIAECALVPCLASSYDMDGTPWCAPQTAASLNRSNASHHPAAADDSPGNRRGH